MVPGQKSHLFRDRSTVGTGRCELSDEFQGSGEDMLIFAMVEA